MLEDNIIVDYMIDITFKTCIISLFSHITMLSGYFCYLSPLLNVQAQFVPEEFDNKIVICAHRAVGSVGPQTMRK